MLGSAELGRSPYSYTRYLVYVICRFFLREFTTSSEVTGDVPIRGPKVDLLLLLLLSPGRHYAQFLWGMTLQKIALFFGGSSSIVFFVGGSSSIARFIPGFDNRLKYKYALSQAVNTLKLYCCCRVTLPVHIPVRLGKFLRK